MQHLLAASLALAGLLVAPVAALAQPQTIMAAGTAIQPAIGQADGTYLYSTSNQPDQVGSEYVVFERRGGTQVSGALYLPSSEFACFSGSLQGQSMNLAVIGVGDTQPHPFNVNLNQYQRLQQVSANDRRILGMCAQVNEQYARMQGAPIQAASNPVSLQK
ncbi:hypothetical protein [Leptolyngbya sp. FACHB-261]|uniref:hypothetical protein n=1 Tax=Leptolyngbya sp. FACHB-261 TaxID=2692806 RepID=UPI0016896B0F|nr:hypothetical protein [Leptolyngbya sp. FACHB-261]MBD2103680.1 hypothetical protein [Leptolyngbya sp. FACHB-261]